MLRADGGAGIEAVVDGWQDGWHEHARVVRVGRRIVVRPAWIEHPDGDADRSTGDVVLVIEPGRTFGFGAHPTTQLVLAMMEDRTSPGARVLDLGCGSGVLSVAAARLGASRVMAIEQEAIAVTAANARGNGVESIVRTPGAGRLVRACPSPGSRDRCAGRSGMDTGDRTGRELLEP